MDDLVKTADKDLSVSIGDYLKAILHLADSGVASTNEIAARLSVAPGSVTRMLARLHEKGLVRHERYRGVSLTDEGRTEALRLLRRHRLIETFLLEHLGYSWEEVHEEAEHLEHAVSDKFTERLAKHLGHPKHDPHGAPIPTANGALPSTGAYPLVRAETGSRVRVSRIIDESAPTLEHLGERGIMPGALLAIEEVRPVDGVVTVRDEEGRAHPLGECLANAVLVCSVS